MDETASNFNHDAKKDNGSCVYKAPSTYSFTNEAGNSTVSYTGQSNRLDQLGEMGIYAKAGSNNMVSSSILYDMFANTGGNGGGNFSFTASQNTKSNCFELDTALIISYFDSLALASSSNGMTASSGQAGVLTSGTKSYLLSANGFEYAQLIEKGLMGAVLYYQLNSVYLASGKIDLDNTTPITGEFYTGMEHSFDEAFGYFGASTDFPTNLTDIRFWGEYCNKQNSSYGLNATLMNAF